MERIPLGIVGARFALELISSDLTGRFAGVAAVFEPDERTAARSEPLLRNKRVYLFRDYKKFLVCGIKAVVISSGLDRVNWAVKALRAKLDVLCEPPAALDADEFARLERAVRDSGKSFVLAEYACHRREVLLAEKLYRRGDIGRLLTADSSEFAEDNGAPACAQSSGSIGKLVVTTKLGVSGAVCFESLAHGIVIGTEMLNLSNGAHARALNGNFGVESSLRLIGESGVIEASRGRVRLTDCSSLTEKSCSIRPEGFMLTGMTGDDFAKSSAIDSFALKLLGDNVAAARCVDFPRMCEIVREVLGKSGRRDVGSQPYGYNIERK